MNIIVTGSEGFLGRAVVARLVADGHQVVAVDRVYHDSPGIKDVVYHHADLDDPFNLLPKSESQNPNFALIHLAWDMRRYEGYAIQAGQVRIFASLLDYWSTRGLQKVIFMGSAEEYGHRSGVIAETDEPELPLSPYGWAKRSARSLLQSWTSRTGIPSAIMRPFVMYGPGQKGDMLIPTAIEAAKDKRRTSFTDGKQWRDFVYIDDVVRAISRAVVLEASGFQEFNLGSGGVMVSDVLTGIAAKYNAVPFFALGARPRRPGEPDRQIADTSRAAAVLGWKAETDWASGLAKI